MWRKHLEPNNLRVTLAFIVALVLVVTSDDQARAMEWATALLAGLGLGQKS